MNVFLKTRSFICGITGEPGAVWKRPYLLELEWDLQCLAEKDIEKLRDIRRRLNDLSHRLEGKRMAGVVQAVISVVNYHQRKLSYEWPRDNHKITDHAFCRGMERYLGVNVTRAKDRMLKIAQKENWDFIERDSKIATFLPKKASAK